VNCCGRYSAAEKHFDRKVAERDLRRYRHKGAQGITRTLLTELRHWSLQEKHLLDVGAGIGVISAELAANGLSSTTLVEASPAYLDTARRVTEPYFISRPAQFLLGDFTVIAPTLNDADVVTLDRVVCCYPDAQALLRAAASRTRQLLAFTYPRDRWYVRTTIALENFIRGLKQNVFRTFVHKPEDMNAVLEAAGFVRVTRRDTLVWALDIYQRNGAVSTILDDTPQS